MTLRRAEAGDAAAIRAVVQAAYQPYVDELGLRPAPMDRDPIGEMETKDVWVAEKDGEVFGLVVARVEPDHLFIDNVAVAPGAQGRGLGRLLLARAEEHAAELGRDEVRLLTNERMTRNREMYAHLGWEETELRAQHGYSRVFLRKSVSPVAG